MKSYKTAFWAGFIASLILFFAPVHTSVGGGFGFDKDIHAAIFAGLVFTAMKAFPKLKLPTVLLLCVYAYAVEYVQGRYFPLRHFDWYDITADVIGLILGILAYLLIRKNVKSGT